MSESWLVNAVLWHRLRFCHWTIGWLEGFGLDRLVNKTQRKYFQCSKTFSLFRWKFVFSYNRCFAIWGSHFAERWIQPRSGFSLSWFWVRRLWILINNEFSDKLTYTYLPTYFPTFSLTHTHTHTYTHTHIYICIYIYISTG